MSLVPLTSTAPAAGSGRAGAVTAEAGSGDAFAALLASPALTLRARTPQHGSRPSTGSPGSPAGTAGPDGTHGAGQDAVHGYPAGPVHESPTRTSARPVDGHHAATGGSPAVAAASTSTSGAAAPGTDGPVADSPSTADPVADAARSAAADALAVLSAAQVVAAAQLVPVSPLLASAVRSEMATVSATPSPVDAVGPVSPAGAGQPLDPAALAAAPPVGGQGGGSDAPGAPNPPVNGMRSGTLTALADAVPTDAAPSAGTVTVGVQSTDHTDDPSNLNVDKNVTEPSTSRTPPDRAVTVDGLQSGQPRTAQGQGEPLKDGRSGGQQAPNAPLTDVSARATGVEPPAVQDSTQATQQASHPGHDTGDGTGQPQGARVEGPSSAPGAAAASTTTQPAGPATSVPTTPVGTEQAAAGQPPASYGVAEQVFAQMSRLVSRGDGTRRITMNLQPELLGDVRVVLTVRGGEVQVRMSGGDLAQQALLRGAPELHRLLDSVGATSSRIVVGENGASFQQSAGTAQDGRQPADQYRGGTAGHVGDHSDRPGDGQSHRGAGTRHGDTSARDGYPQGSVRTHLPTDPGTRTRPGVDVTM